MDGSIYVGRYCWESDINDDSDDNDESDDIDDDEFDEIGRCVE